MRRVLVPVVVVVAFLGALLAGRESQATTSTRFAIPPFASRPYASHSTPISTTWYCPGMQASDPTFGGQIVVANPTDVPINGHITYVGSDGTAPVVQPIVASPRDKLVLDIEQVVVANYASAIVELEGGAGFVEQEAFYPAGNAVASCITQTSPTWYFADGWTIDGSTDTLLITNPSQDKVSVDVTFYSKSGPLTPTQFQGDTIDPQSVKAITIAESGFKDEDTIGVKVEANRGRVITARAQHYLGGGRLGYTLNLGAPAPSEQVWFADGDHGPGVTEEYVLLNPTDEDATVDVTVLGIPALEGFVPPEPIPVPAHDVVRFDMKDVQGLPDGRHSIVFATLDEPSIVVERVLTQTTDGKPATSVVLGMTPEYSWATRWYLGIGTDEADEDGIVVYNPFQDAATISLKAVGPGGEVPVPNMDEIPLPGGATVAIPLTDPSLFGKIIVVDASAGVYVERRLPRGGNLTGRSGSWALPDCGPCIFSSPPSS
jgi:hypothetical protein